MPAEKYVTEFVKEAGFTPIPDRAIIVTYAPANMSERIAKFFSNEFFALQMCQDSLVLLPFGRMSLMLKKDVALEIPYHTIRKVEVKEDMLNWRIELDTDEGMIVLSAQQKELSEWRHSGTLSVGMSGLGSGITGSGALKVANWHRSNLYANLEALKALPFLMVRLPSIWNFSLPKAGRRSGIPLLHSRPTCGVLYLPFHSYFWLEGCIGYSCLTGRFCRITPA